MWEYYPVQMEFRESFGEGKFEFGNAVQTSKVFGGGGGHVGEKGEGPRWSDGDFVDQT